METAAAETHPFREALWRNYAASLDMVANAIALYPEDAWLAEGKFYFMAFHTAIFADYYLSHPVHHFAPRIMYSLCETDQIPEAALDDVLPKTLVSQQEILDYLKHIRRKAKKLISETSITEFTQNWITRDEAEMHGLCPGLVVDYSLLEILFYNLRHIQHHSGQLNLLLRHETGQGVDWIAMAE